MNWKFWQRKKPEKPEVPPTQYPNIWFSIERVPFGELVVKVYWPTPRNEEDGIKIANDVAEVVGWNCFGHLFAMFQAAIVRQGDWTNTKGVAATALSILNRNNKHEKLVVTPEEAFAKTL